MTAENVGEEERESNPLADMFGWPELERARSLLSSLSNASDREAVIFAASVVDDYLLETLEIAAPSDLNKSRRNRALHYPGPFSSLAARAELCRWIGLIDGDLHAAIDALRAVRNDVAHSGDKFELEFQDQRLAKLKELGGGMAPVVNRLSNELTIRSYIDAFRAAVAEDEKLRALFENDGEAREALFGNQEIMATLQQRALRLELGFATLFICSLLVMNRRRLLEDDPRSKFVRAWRSAPTS